MPDAGDPPPPEHDGTPATEPPAVGGSGRPMRPADARFDTADLQRDLGRRSARGGAVTAASQAATFALNLGSTAALARLLTPGDFGLIAMVTAFTGFVGLFKDMGLSAAVVQRAEVTHRQVSTLFWINLAVCGGLAALVAAASPLIAWFYGEPRLVLIAAALALDVAVSGLLLQHQALLNRRMRFTSLAAAQLGARVGSYALAILLAWRGWGYWSLVALTLSYTGLLAANLWLLSGWLPGLPVRGAGVRGMLRFGANLTGFNFLNYFSRNLDNLLIGKVSGEAALGLYVKAYSLLMLPLSQINAPLTAVMVPALSRVQDQPEKFARGYLKGVSLSMTFTAPLTAFLFFWSEHVIRLVLGPQWTAAGELFRILALAAILHPLGNTTGWLLIPLGRTDRLLRWKLMTFWLTPLFFLIGVVWAGPKGVAWALVAGTWIVTFPTLWYAAQDTGITVGQVVRASWRPVVAAAGASLLLFEVLEGRVFVLLALAVLPLVYLPLLCLLAGSLRPLRDLQDLVRAATRRGKGGLV